MLPPEVQEKIRHRLDAATKGDAPLIPGLVYASVQADGDILFEHAAGARGLGVNEPMTLDTMFYMASFTKLVTGVACMQLVEQGRIGLDSAEDVSRWAPELVDVQVITRVEDGSLQLRPKDRSITLRMLLNHTAGFGYAFEDTKYIEWARPVGLEDFSGNAADVLSRPLVNQPGTKFQYGTSIDWVGVLIERITGSSLENHFREAIFGPLGIESFTFFPEPTSIGRLSYMHYRSPDGSLSLRDHIYRYPLLNNSDSGTRFCMGGGGLFGQPTEMCKLIAVLLNNGTCPRRGVQLLKPETIDEMFTDQIPDMPRDCNEYTPTSRPDLANPTPLMPAPEGATEGWGLTFSLSHQESSSGRAAGTASWEGLPNLFWFADRKNGVGGIIASQILPYGDINVLNVSNDVETMIYNELFSR